MYIYICIYIYLLFITIISTGETDFFHQQQLPGHFGLFKTFKDSSAEVTCCWRTLGGYVGGRKGQLDNYRIASPIWHLRFDVLRCFSNISKWNEINRWNWKRKQVKLKDETRFTNHKKTLPRTLHPIFPSQPSLSSLAQLDHGSTLRWLKRPRNPWNVPSWRLALAWERNTIQKESKAPKKRNPHLLLGEDPLS